MIYELNKDEYVNLNQLDKYYNIEIPAIISGFNTGKIFTDSKTHPRTAMIWTKDGTFFTGDTNNRKFDTHINEFVDSTIKKLSKSLGIKWFEICSVSKEWDKKIEELFKDRELSKSNQFVYRMNNIDEERLDLKELKGNIKIHEISKEFFEYPYTNKQYFIDDILLFWDSIEEFCDKGFGFFITKDKNILSRCTLDFKHINICTLGVSTDKNYRKKGYAKRVVSETLMYCKHKGLDPYWDCMESNKGSIALAESVGFKKDYIYSLYEFKFL